MKSNFFSNEDPDLPNLKNLKLPKIRTGLPKIKVTDNSNLLFEIDGKNYLMDEIADNFGNLYFQS